MRQWDLNLWSDSTSPTATAVWDFELPIGRVKHGVSLDFGATESLPPQQVRHEFLFRILCHTMIDSLPAIALREAAENMADILRFYYPTPARLPKGSVSAQLPKLQGRIGTPQKPTPFYLPEEP